MTPAAPPAAPPDPPAPAPIPPETPQQREHTVALLYIGLVTFTLLTAGATIWLPKDSALIGFLLATAGNFSGALFLRLKG